MPGPFRRGNAKPRRKSSKPFEDVEGSSEKVCRVMVEYKGTLYRWYHTDSELTERTAVKFFKKENVLISSFHKCVEDKITTDIFQIAGVTEISISRYLVGVQVANSFFPWDEIEPKVLKSIEEGLGVQIKFVGRGPFVRKIGTVAIKDGNKIKKKFNK